MNLDNVIRFCEAIKDKKQKHPDRKLICLADSSPRQLTNAVFLLGAYLIREQQHMSPEEIWDIFKHMQDRLEGFRDATFSVDSFLLSLLDCWRGLHRAQGLGWVDAIDMDEYVHYDSPLEGDLHIVVPDKLIAFRGPVHVPESTKYMDRAGCRLFSPSFYADAAFADMEVSIVVRLNEPEYDPADFEEHGIRCVDLEFEDCTPPPAHIVAEFLHTVDRAAGAVAVHCKAGLGRTGTLIAAYLMRTHGFTAREAMGWLRIVRPGSVIGEQQEYLCRLEAAAFDLAAVDAERSGLGGDRSVWGLVGSRSVEGDSPAGPEPERLLCAEDGNDVSTMSGADEEGSAARSRRLAGEVAAALVSGERTARRARRLLLMELTA
jgi:cell division cycle 14